MIDLLGYLQCIFWAFCWCRRMLVECLLSSFVSILLDRNFSLATYAHPPHFSLRLYSGTDNTTYLFNIITSSDNRHYSWNERNDPPARAL